mgnify:CR=1 FL=1
MKLLGSLKSALRRALGAPFRLERRDCPPGVTFELFGTHSARLRSPTIKGHDAAMVAFREKRWELRDFVATIRGPVLLDTGLGWVVRGRDLLEVGNWSMVAQSTVPTKPSILRWARAMVGAEDVGPAVWLPFGAGNYWHFLNDMVAGLALLAERRDLSGCVVLVSEELAGKAFFKELVGLSSLLSGLSWRTYRHDRWLRSSELHVAGTSFGSYATFRRAIGLLDRLPPIKARPVRKLFVTRSPQAGRNPARLDALTAALTTRGFEQVQFEGLTVVEQRALVNEAACVVAVHGAGMANLAFHEAPAGVKLLEITPSDHFNPCFAFMAEEAGMDYFCFAGGKRDFAQGETYEVPVDAFLEALDLFVAR